MNTRTKVLNAVLNHHPIEATRIAEVIHCHLASVRKYLTALYHDGLIDRKPSEGQQPRAKAYFPKEGAEDKWEKEWSGEKKEKVSKLKALRQGELFTREEVAAYRKRYGRLKSHGVIRT